jgi:hypothetical protein
MIQKHKKRRRVKRMIKTKLLKKRKKSSKNRIIKTLIRLLESNSNFREENDRL